MEPSIKPAGHHLQNIQRARGIRRPKVHVTRHARERAVQRHGLSVASAAQQLRSAFGSSVKVPPRYARQLSYANLPNKPTKSQRRQWRVAGSMLLICRGTCVLTTWRLTPEQAATVLWWAATGWWVMTTEVTRG